MLSSWFQSPNYLLFSLFFQFPHLFQSLESRSAYSLSRTVSGGEEKGGGVGGLMARGEEVKEVWRCG